MDESNILAWGCLCVTVIMFECQSNVEKQPTIMTKQTKKGDFGTEKWKKGDEQNLEEKKEQKLQIRETESDIKQRMTKQRKTKQRITTDGTMTNTTSQ